MSFACAVRRIAAILVFALALSCGGTPPAPQAPAARVDPPAAPPVPLSPDLSAVPEPPALVVSARLGKPSASMAILQEWTKLPMPQSEQVSELALGEAVGPWVDLDQPIDFAVAVVGTGAGMRDRTAISVALKDADHAKAALADRYKLVPADNGALLVQGLGRSKNGGEDDRGEDDHRVCELAPAFGASALRLVCGRSAEALAELAPWLTRTLARAPAVDDLRIDVRMRALRATLSKDRRLLVMLLANEFGERVGWAHGSAASVARELVDFALDLETLSLVVTLSEPAASAWLGFKLSGNASSIAHLVNASPKPGPATPTAFWQLPAEAAIAGFEPGIDGALWAQWRDHVLRNVGDELSGIGVREADRTAIADAVGKLVPAAAISYASGCDSEAVRKALAAESSVGDGAPSADRAEAKRTSIEALFGWHLVEVDQPSAQWIGGLKDLAAAWGRAGVAEAYRAGAKDRAPPSLHSAPSPPGIVLPPGAQHYVLDLRALAPALATAGSGPVVAKGSKAANPLTIHVFVAPDGPHTWVALGANDLVLASKLAIAMGGAGEKLAARGELADLKPPVTLGGFVTLRGLVEVAQRAALFSGGSTHAAAQAFGALASLPHHGAAPVSLFWGDYPGAVAPSPPGRAAPSGLHVVLPRAAIEDAVTEIVRHGGF